MRKGKRTEAEFELHEEAIIQHIQSYLRGKEAAQTTLVSKSWYSAWLTRPNLDFDENDFERKRKSPDTQSSENRFLEFVKKTVERFGKLNLKIHSLKLWIKDSYNTKHYSYPLVNNLITKALKMGATVLDLKIYCYQCSSFTLPHEVFRSENLIRLSVSECKIGIGADGKISCSRLKSLTLHEVSVEGDIIWDIILSCPLIEKLSLSFTNNREALNPSSTEFGKRIIAGSPFNKLKCLMLYGIDVHTLFLNDFCSTFPCLKDLALHRFSGYDDIQISSPSLECINFTHNKMLTMKFDVPNIRKFTFSGLIVPPLSFNVTTSTWESDISIKRKQAPSATWFLELNKLLKKLSPSRVSLSLKILTAERLDYPERVKSLLKPEVENLTINGPYSVCPALFYSLFWCCRPIYISQKWFLNYFGPEMKTMEFVNKRMMHHVSLDTCIAYQSLSGERDLKEVSVEFYDEFASAWKPRLLDTSSLGADEHRIRLHLRWIN